MNNEATYRGPGDEIPFTAATDLASGEVMQMGGMAGIVDGLSVKAGDAAVLRVKGRVDVKSATATVFTAGDIVSWDNATKLAVVGGGGTFDIGLAVSSKAAGQLFVTVMLNE